MELIIFIISLCGQPDLITIVEEGKQPYFYTWEDVRSNEQVYRDFAIQTSKDKATIVIIPDERGICT